MSWKTNSFIISLRNLGRAIGLNSLLVKATVSNDYEDKFQKEMLSEVNPGDCVWDVGANQGLYSRKFSEIVGATGKVIAFEPSPININQLKNNIESLSNVVLLSIALGDNEGSVRFRQGDDPLGATSSVVAEENEKLAESIDVEISSGDYLIASGVVPVPNVIKIDTEGFELEVLRGLNKTLQKSDLRALFIEVHFGLLKDRGLAHAPAEIEKILQGFGFEITWPDNSHIIANLASG